MLTFKFKAKNLEGKEISGSREAADKFALAKDLKKEGYVLTDFEEMGKKKRFSFSFLGSLFGIPFSEKMIFTRNLKVMIKSGVAVAKALDILKRQTKNKKFQNVISDILGNVKKGKGVSASMALHDKVFSNLYVSMVSAGEKSGNLAESLKLLSDQMEKNFLLRRKIKGAMVYPCIVLTAMVAIGILMLIYVVPILVSTFKELGVDLPLSTKIIIWLSESLVTNLLMIFAVCGGAVALFLWALRKQAVKNFKDRFLLRLPLISGLMQKINSARTARTLSSLIDSGVEILEALDITVNVLQNVCYKKVLIEAKKDIQTGAPISASFLKNDTVFPPVLGEMMAVGEETGQLSNMLLDLANFYEEEVAQATKNLSTVIEPVLTLVIGAAVGFFAISVIQPIYGMVSGL